MSELPDDLVRLQRARDAANRAVVEWAAAHRGRCTSEQSEAWWALLRAETAAVHALHGHPVMAAWTGPERAKKIQALRAAASAEAAPAAA